MTEHLSDQVCRSYLDGELDPAARRECELHLAACRACTRRVDELHRQAEFVNSRLAFLDQTPPRQMPSTAAARARLKERIHEKENQTMFQKLFTRRFRLGLTGGLAAVLMTLIFTVPAVGAMASNFLSIFRVDQVAVVPVNPANLPEDLTGYSARMENIFNEDVQMEAEGEVQQAADAAEASSLAGFEVRLPEKMKTEGKTSVQPAMSGTYRVNLERLNALLHDMGRDDIAFPENLDAANIAVTIPASVTTTLGDCKVEDPDEVGEKAEETGDPDEGGTPASDCTVFVQVPSPTVTAPDGLDTHQLGVTFLQLAGMSPEEAESFSQQIDWTATLVVPVPLDRKDQSEVEVDGVTGTLIEIQTEHSGNRYMLIWAKDGLVYSLAGPGKGAEGLELAGTLN